MNLWELHLKRNKLWVECGSCGLKKLQRVALRLGPNVTELAEYYTQRRTNNNKRLERS
jgi:hypothetical protein